MASDPSTPTKTISAHCLCNAVNLTFTLPTSLLPLDSYMCHCSICRRILGTLSCFHSQLPRGIVPSFIAPSSEANLIRYNWPANKDDWLFCSTCGCHVGTTNPRSDSSAEEGGICWTISTSIFPTDESVFVLKQNCFTHSAPGGGLDEWVTTYGDRTLEAWNPPEDKPAEIPARSDAVSADKGKEQLLAECHCGGVSLRISRPPSANRPFVSPIDGNKWVGLVDPCDSCRLVTGAHVTAWTFITQGSIEVATTTGGKKSEDREWNMVEMIGQEDLGVSLGGRTTVKVFESSKGVKRSFCGTCGATIMYACDSRNGVVDVAVGILRAPDVRAEDWLTWRAGRIGWLEDGLKYDRKFAEALRDGMAKWSVVKYGEAYDFGPVG